MKEKFNIAICSLDRISEVIRKRKTDWDIVSIRNSGGDFPVIVETQMVSFVNLH